MSYAEHLKVVKGSNIKARKNFMREYHLTEEDWYNMWITGLARDIEIANTPQ